MRLVKNSLSMPLTVQTHAENDGDDMDNDKGNISIGPPSDYLNNKQQRYLYIVTRNSILVAVVIIATELHSLMFNLLTMFFFWT